MNKKTDEKKYLSFIQKIGYGMGDFGSNYCWTFVASFIMIYCTNILGVSAGVIGTVMMLSKFIDGITDVFMGRVIDRTKSKMGKARFWYFVSAFPVAFCTFLLFNVPASFTANTKYAYIFITYTLMGAVFYTMNNIAYSSLTAFVTKNPKERVQMGSYRFIFAILAVLMISSFTSGLVDQFGGGQEGWRAVSIIYSIICLVFLLIPVFAVKELPETELLDEGKQKEKEPEIGFFKAFVYLLKNKYFVLIVIYYLFFYLFNGITQGMGIYFATYQLKNASLLGPISMASLLPTLLILPFVPQLTEKFGIQKVAIAGYIIAVIGGIAAIAGGLTGGFTLLLVGMIVKAIGISPLTGSLNALIAETDDYSQLKFGQRLTGTIYSCSSVGLKVGTGLGTAACGILLQSGKFDGTAAIQPASAINIINYSYLAAVVLMPIITLIILSFLNVEKENRHLRAQNK